MSAKQTKEPATGTKHPAKATKHRSASKKADELARWNDRRFDFGKKFAVFVYGEDVRQAFHLFTSKKEAFLYFFTLAYASLSGTKVRDIHGDFVKVLGVRVYEV